jgi:hypothetical protein
MQRAAAEDITVRVREHIGHTEWDITAKTRDFKKVDATKIEFEVPVPKNGKAEVAYTVHERW